MVRGVWQTQASLVLYKPEMLGKRVVSLHCLNIGLEDVSLYLWSSVRVSVSYVHVDDRSGRRSGNSDVLR